jgi:predicted aldo/keto reductase-like oxidoreductase
MGGMEYRPLGRLDHRSSVLILGGFALARVDQAAADACVAQALDAGINHVDVAANYGDAELRLGPALAGSRDRVFLATKTQQRDAEPAWAEINRSLERLQTDHVDLLQLHAIGDVAELDQALRPGGAIEAAIRARDEGLTGAIGITGHGPGAAAVHREALQRFDFDTVLTPLNAALWRDPSFRAAYQDLVAEIRRRGAGLMTIKAGARRNYPDIGAGEPVVGKPFTTWYEPLDTAERFRASISWVLDHPEVTGVATPGDVTLLGSCIAAERDRMPLDEARAVLAAIDDYTSPFDRMPA